MVCPASAVMLQEHFGSGMDASPLETPFAFCAEMSPNRRNPTQAELLGTEAELDCPWVIHLASEHFSKE